jgi:hypothetical protein
MATTPRFGLDYFGIGTSGSFASNGGKFTGRDRLLIDRVLANLETHDHSGGTQLASPTFTPGLSLSSTGGLLPAGRTFYYRVSLIDHFGLETAASAEVSEITQGGIAPPGTPVLELATPPGASELSNGLYYYVFTLFKNNNETQQSPPAVMTITNSSLKAVGVSAPPSGFAGADQVEVWRLGPTEAAYTRLGKFSLPLADLNNFFIDDGSIPASPNATNPTYLPPLDNRTNASNAITISIPAFSAGDGVVAWRIYRTSTQGIYGPSSLVAEVTTEVSPGVLVNSYQDLGADLSTGQPLDLSQALSPSVQLSGEGIAVTPTGNLIATDVQAALAELDTEKASTAALATAEATAATELSTHAGTLGNTGHIEQQAVVASLALTISDPPTQAEVQAVANKIDEILLALRAAGLIAI